MFQYSFKKLLSAEQGFFICEDCGSNTIEVISSFYRDYCCSEAIKCTCGKSQNSIAAIRTTTKTEYRIETGNLQEDRTWSPFEISVLGEDTDSCHLEIYCQACTDKAAWYDWFFHHMHAWDDYSDEDAGISLFCDGCGRELEFGIDEHRHIWPVECSDFDSSKCEPYDGTWSWEE